MMMAARGEIERLPLSLPQRSTINQDNLTAGGLNLGSLNLLGRLHVGTTGIGVLDLFSTLGSFHVLLLLLGVFGGGGTGGLLDGFGFGTLGSNFFPGGTDDGTLNLDGLAGTTLGNFLGGSLLVETTVEDGPAEFTGILLGLEVGSAFTVQ